MEGGVTHREFDSTIEFLQADIADVKGDVSEIRKDVKALLRAHIITEATAAQERIHRKARQFWIGIAAAMASAIVAATVSTLITLQLRPAPTPAAITLPHWVV